MPPVSDATGSAPDLAATPAHAEEPAPDFPGLHIRPAVGWVNDPNGVCRVDGTYHVFFQYNPRAPVHGDIHWGHASSPDLLHWTQQPIALAPRPGLADAAGCWSGCVVDDAGVPTAIYTAVPDHPRNAGVVLARSDETLQHWTADVRPVIGTPDRAGVEEVRDPFVFTVDGRRYAVQGAGARHGSPQLLLWGCDDLDHWVDLGPLLTPEDPVAAAVGPANIWECPNLALVEGRWVLLISLWRWVEETHELAGVRYLVGDLAAEGDGLRFVAAAGGVLDTGAAFYAPQLMSEPDRTLLWGWSWEVGRSEAQVEAAGWAGSLTFPRELSVVDDLLWCRPASELSALRRGPLSALDQPFAERAFELELTGPGRLRLTDEGAELFAIDVDGAPDDPCTVLVDASMVEVFRHGVSRTERAYPTMTSRWALTASTGAVTGYLLGP